MALVLIGFVAFSEQQKKIGAGLVAQYQSTDTDKPIATADLITQDIGSMRVSDEKTVDFTVKNTGIQPLALYKLNTSCGCTAVQVSINGVKSPEVSMHQQNNWTATVPPGKEATVSLIYRPQIMPVKGEVSRSVYVQTNDPVQKQLTFSIKAFVE